MTENYGLNKTVKLSLVLKQTQPENQIQKYLPDFVKS